MSHSSRTYGTSTYEGEGKTTATILNEEPGSGVMINAYSQVREFLFCLNLYCVGCILDHLQVGFRLNNDVTILGSVAIFPRFDRMQLF